MGQEEVWGGRKKAPMGWDGRVLAWTATEEQEEGENSATKPSAKKQQNKKKQQTKNAQHQETINTAYKQTEGQGSEGKQEAERKKSCA